MNLFTQLSHYVSFMSLKSISKTILGLYLKKQNNNYSVFLKIQAKLI